MWYESEVPSPEDEAVARVMLQEQAKQLDGKTKRTLQRVYGEGLEGMPASFGFDAGWAESFLARLCCLDSPRDREIVLERFGLVTGAPAGVHELAVRHGVPVRHIHEVDIAFLKLRERFRIIRPYESDGNG